MNFNILTHNHGGAHLSVEILFQHIRDTLSLCGHEVSIATNRMTGDSLNLYLEYFPEKQDYASVFRKIRQDTGYRIGVITTEVVRNGEIPYAHLMTGDVSRRLMNMELVAREVDFVWSLSEGTARDYESKTAISEFFPYGCTGLVDAERRRSRKDIDVFFFGGHTEHRERILQSLLDAGIKVVAVGDGFPGGSLPKYMIDSFMDRSKIGLNLTMLPKPQRPDESDPRFISATRVVRMLERELLVVSETIPGENPYRDYMISGEVEDLTAICKNIIDQGLWVEEGRARARRFQEQMDVRRICAPAIDRTLRRLKL